MCYLCADCEFAQFGYILLRNFVAGLYDIMCCDICVVLCFVWFCNKLEVASNPLVGLKKLFEILIDFIKQLQYLIWRMLFYAQLSFSWVLIVQQSAYVMVSMRNLWNKINEYKQFLVKLEIPQRGN